MRGAHRPPGRNSRQSAASADLTRRHTACEHALPMPQPPVRAGFIGRVAERAAVRRRWAEGVRLVTLVGPPGSGKSRLAARLVEGDEGVIIVDVAGSRELGHARDRVAELLASSPGLRVLVTARRRLRSKAEAVIQVGALTKADAVALYEHRARMVEHDFELTLATRPIVEEIVEQLDRLPLAVELAASRIDVLKPRDLLDRLGSRLDILSCDDADGEPRHVTLRAALEDEWWALPGWGRAAVRQLATFSSSFSLSDAEALLDAREHEEMPSAIAVLAHLCDACVLVSERGGGRTESRFRLYETMRALTTSECPAAPVRLVAARSPALRLLPSPRAEGAALVVGRRSDWFSLPDGRRIDLGTRAPLQRVLERLVEVRIARPGCGVTSDELINAAWPGERMSRDAGLHRVHVAIATLRKMGLGNVLMTQTLGYLLSPHVHLAREDAPPSEASGLHW